MDGSDGNRPFTLGTPPVAGAPTDRTEIDQCRDEQPEEVDSRDGQTAMDHPSIKERGQWQEYEPENQDQDIVKNRIEVGGEQEQQHQGHARECQDKDQQ